MQFAEMIASIPYFSGNRDWTYYDKVGNFDYSLGAEVAGLAKGADALLLISCIDVNPTSGREAVQAGTLLMTMPLILFGGTPVLLPGEFTMGSISLVEAKSGTILWHKLYQSEAAHDLSSPLKTYELIIQNMHANPQMMNQRIVENMPARLSNRNGFKIVYTYRTQGGLKKKGIIYGLIMDPGCYQLKYEAAQRHYFARELPAFAQVKGSFRLIKMPH